MAGRLIGNGSANSSTVASPSASRRTIERRVGSDKAAKTTSNRSGAVTGIVAVPPADISQTRYLTDFLNSVKPAVVTTRLGSAGFQDRLEEGEVLAVGTLHGARHERRRDFGEACRLTAIAQL